VRDGGSLGRRQHRRREMLKGAAAFTAAVSISSSSLVWEGNAMKRPVSRALTAKEVGKLLALSPAPDPEIARKTMLDAYRLDRGEALLVFHNGTGRLYEFRAALLEMIDAIERDVVDEEPWENRRGAYTIDYNNTLALIQAPVDEVARALAGQTGRWDQDVLDKDIVVSEEGAFIFRLRRHVWTEAVAEPSKAGLEQALSSLLGTRVISYTVSDTVGAIGYSLYERGELLEEFAASDNGSGRASSDTKFSSRLRSPKQDEIDDIWRFAEEFLIAQDAFEPGIEFRHFFGRQRYRPGELLKVVNPRFVRAGRNERAVGLPPIERVDYVALRQSDR
jgi:hypothetical protein